MGYLYGRLYFYEPFCVIMLIESETKNRISKYAYCVLIGICLAVIIALFSGEGAFILSGRLGGDFPAFYAAGKIIAKGEHNQIYNIEFQKKEQKNLIQDAGAFLPFSYPYYVALLYAPLSLLPYRLAYVIQLIMMNLALLLSVFFICNNMERLRKNFLSTIVGTITFFPIFTAIFQGQNTTLTLLFITLTWHFTLKKRDIAAGLFLGLLLYKPQFGLPLLGIFILSKRFKTACVASIILLGAIVVGNINYGSDWKIDWLIFSKQFSATDALLNQNNAISIIGFTEAVAGADNKAIIFAAWIVSIAIGLFLSAVWFIGGKKACLTDQISLACISIVLMPPHVMFYDIGICLLPFLAIREKMTSYKNVFTISVWIVGLTQLFRGIIGFSLLFILGFLIFFLSIIYFTPRALNDGIRGSKRNDSLYPAETSAMT